MNIFTSIYRCFFPAPTVGSIMASFEKQQAALNKVACECGQREETIRATLQELEAQREATINEHAKAIRVASKLAQFTA